ncbi:hypothetical protein AVANS14531_07900 [Campylobacter sp. Cr9]|uniref:hypothetical protein n=1 Tax=Campylobacter sp. Cr9 TaxID=2735728 RepID=UPI0030155E79|nr:hypothetical protein [Campylobacter sp. Cr9]
MTISNNNQHILDLKQLFLRDEIKTDKDLNAKPVSDLKGISNLYNHDNWGKSFSGVSKNGEVTIYGRLLGLDDKSNLNELSKLLSFIMTNSNSLNGQIALNDELESLLNSDLSIEEFKPRWLLAITKDLAAKELDTKEIKREPIEVKSDFKTYKENLASLVKTLREQKDSYDAYVLSMLETEFLNKRV